MEPDTRGPQYPLHGSASLSFLGSLSYKRSLGPSAPRLRPAHYTPTGIPGPVLSSPRPPVLLKAPLPIFNKIDMNCKL